VFFIADISVIGISVNLLIGAPLVFSKLNKIITQQSSAPYNQEKHSQVKQEVESHKGTSYRIRDFETTSIRREVNIFCV